MSFHNNKIWVNCFLLLKAILRTTLDEFEMEICAPALTGWFLFFWLQLVLEKTSLLVARASDCIIYFIISMWIMYILELCKVFAPWTQKDWDKHCLKSIFQSGNMVPAFIWCSELHCIRSYLAILWTKSSYQIQLRHFQC